MSYIGGLYTGVKYVAGLVNNNEQVAKLDDFLRAAIDARKTDSIVSIFMMPHSFYTSGTIPVTKNVGMERPTKVNGYKPKNKKLLTYPFTFMTVDTLNSSKSYRYEWSQRKDLLSFAMTCAMSPNPEILVTPRGYNGSEGATEETAMVNPTESVTCSGFPQCAFSIDAYRAWLAQKSTGDLLGLFGSGIVTGASVATGNLVGGTLGVVGMASQTNNMLLEATNGAKARGTIGTSTEVGWRVKGVYFKQMSITKEYAEMIDDFFDRYGYATCKVKVPNRNVRPHWTYTKTRNVAIRGSVPTDDMAKIKSIYDSGITFWRNGSEVGQYNLNNSPS